MNEFDMHSREISLSVSNCTNFHATGLYCKI